MITYELGKSLYINMTNRCTNHCTFCIRNKRAGFTAEDTLWLKREPSVDEILTDIRAKQATRSRYQEFVFCGYGEPLIRAFDIIDLCRSFKDEYKKIPLRINTNGQANLICGVDITPLLANLVDAISISLNAQNAQSYQSLCHSDFGETAYHAMLDFAAKCKNYIPRVTLSVVDIIPPEEIDACREIAERLGVDFIIRHIVD